jgi:hypothetical protein
MSISQSLKNKNIRSYTTDQINKIQKDKKKEELKVFLKEIAGDFLVILPFIAIFYVLLSLFIHVII